MHNIVMLEKNIIINHSYNQVKNIIYYDRKRHTNKRII